jgi:DMSO/TMAO reductase YedYZ molybdopterin-dependent catalytic subunit
MMPSRTQITRHDCVEGWSAIAKWTGVPLHEILARVQPEPSARYVVFHCADPMQPNGTQPYYESIDMIDAHHPQDDPGVRTERRGAADRQRRADTQCASNVSSATRWPSTSCGSNWSIVTQGIRGGNGGYWEDRGYAWYAGI